MLSGGLPDYRCRLPDDANVTASVPLVDGEPSSCQMYVNSSSSSSSSGSGSSSSSSDSSSSSSSSSREVVDCLQGYEYSGDVGHTIVSEVGARRHSAFKRRRCHTLVLESQL